MTEKKEETALSVMEENSQELMPSSQIAKEQHEIQSAIIISKKFPRNEDTSYQKLMKACKRSSFAEEANYSFPRGGGQVKGPSVNLAREAARVWGNIRYGLNILRDDEDSRLIEGWAWDIETNTKITAQDDFQKLIYRKTSGWVIPDERDLRELTNRRGAITIRNCLLQLLPKDFIDDALKIASETLKEKIKKDPDEAKKKIIASFSSLNITVEMLEKKLNHPIAESSPTEIQELREIYQSIKDGNSKWNEHIENGNNDQGTLGLDDLKEGKEQNRGHDDTGLGKNKTAKAS